MMLMTNPQPPALPRVARASTVSLRDGSSYLLRPAAQEDEVALAEMLRRTSAEDRRMRFFHTVRGLSQEMAARLLRADRRETAFVAVRDGAIEGAVWAISSSTDGEAEFAVLVRSDRQGRGLGWELMKRMINYARCRGYIAIHGRVLAENQRMLRMCTELGFSKRRDRDDPGVILVRLALGATES
jgi:acetyltransferase